MNTLRVALFILGFVSFGLAQTNNTNLLCYDCDPVNNAEQCGQPGGSSVPQVNCNQLYPNRDANSTLICLSAYLSFSGDRLNSTGIYRGCKSQDSSVVNFCDWFKEETTSQNIVLTSCETCNSSRCNTVTFNGQPKGSSLVQMALTAFGISVLFVFF